MIFRPAIQNDIPDILAIWNPIYEDSELTFSVQGKTDHALAKELQDKTQQNHPFLVAVLGSQVIGFATYSQFRRTDGYAHTMELTIILDNEFQGRGFGKQLMDALENAARADNVVSLIAAIAGQNHSAIAFHAALGHEIVGQLPNVGKKFGKRYDLVLMQKFL